MTQIFPTSRCVREFYASFSNTNQILPKALSVADFESRAVIVPHKSLADEDTRVLLMAEAARFENFKELKIEREFLSFLKNSTYLFRFFEELSSEGVEIKNLHVADTYAQFEEHLSILEELLKNYSKLLNEKNLYDKITLPSQYELNVEFLNSHEGFIFHLEGFLNNYEYTLFRKIANIIPLKIILHVSKYNQKMLHLFDTFELEVGYVYTLNLSTNEIEEAKKLRHSKLNADVRGFTSRILQASYVSEQINVFVKKGIQPENIAVILPDEGFAKILQSFDTHNNLNFAMGESFTQNKIYKKLNALYKYLSADELEHYYRLLRLGIEEQTVQSFKSVWRKKLSSEEIIPLLCSSSKEEQEEEAFNQEIYRYSKLLQRLGKIELSQALKLFLNRLSALSLDDVRGGKVTVMGLLEGRGVHFDGVIVVDFNDEFVPKRSKKDMFLSSHVRQLAKLPSREDRENLQRYFYSQLFLNAKEIAISFTQNDQSMGSRFLDELGLHVRKNIDQKSYFPPLFTTSQQNPRYNPQAISGSYDIKSTPLSASKLKTLLTCKRWFYYKYVLKSREAKLPSNSINEADIGNILHEAMHYVLKDKVFVDADILLLELRRYLLGGDKSLEWIFHLDIWLEHLKNICKNEAKRFEEGYRVYALENSYITHYKGFILEGKIDRIDIKDGKFYVIDYKSGKLPSVSENTLEKCVDFQLEFYSLLVQQYGLVGGVYYYELKSAKLESESLLELKLEKLDEILQSLQEPVSGFEKCESNAPCRFCPFVKLCDRS